MRLLKIFQYKKDFSDINNLDDKIFKILSKKVKLF